MTPTRKRRLIGILVILLGVGIAGTITVFSLRQNMLYFVSPSDVYAESLPLGRQFRLGGLVLPGTVKRGEDGLAVEFDVSDGAASITVSYDGILPDLFKEGQGVITRGVLTSNDQFEAIEVLAKHDENYMPPEVAEALEKTGHTVGNGP
jgi:cytochrome c-type biogenesis protein CcmE